MEGRRRFQCAVASATASSAVRPEKKQSLTSSAACGRTAAGRLRATSRRRRCSSSGGLGSLHFFSGLRYSGEDIVPGAQTERRSGAGPAGGLLGGKDPAGL